MTPPWTDAVTGASGAPALFPRFVCRVSGAPADSLDPLRAERAAALVRELAGVDASLRELREALSARLFAAIGEVEDRPSRNRLVALKRELYNLRAPSEAKVEAALSGAAPDMAAAVRDFVALLARAAELEAGVAEAHDAEFADARGVFRELVRDADFRKGLMVSSRSLYGKLERYRAAADSGSLSGRDEKTERGLLRYYTRMAAKATPFATFCAILPGRFLDEGAVDAPEGETHFTADPRRKRSFVRINKFIYGLLSDHLRTRPAVRRALRVDRNPTLRTEGERLVYLTAVDGREVFQRLADNEVLQLIASRFAGGTPPTLGELIGTLSSDPEIDASPEEAEAYLDRLVEIGFLRFHTGIREQDADWDLPFRAFLDTVDDDHARQAAALLGVLRDGIEEYAAAGVEERAGVIERIDAAIEAALASMEVTARLRRDMAFYEDATADAEAQIALTPGVRSAFATFETWVRATSRMAWPRQEQATMRHFFSTFYGDAAGVPLLQFYEDFYREHFKTHVEKETRLRGGARPDELDGYDVGNPFGLDFVREVGDARTRLSEVIREAWARSPDAATVDVEPEAVEEALGGVETVSGVPRSMGAFALLLPAAGEDDPRLLLQGTSYTAGYGKYFSRFLYMLPDDVQEEVRRANGALTGELLAEICGDAQFNANLHPPLMRWEISYPTGESGVTDEQLPSSEIRVEPDPEDPHALRLVRASTGERVIPVDLGFLNPRMRPPLYQLLSRFTPPVMFGAGIPESPLAPRPRSAPAEAPPAAAPAGGVGETPAETASPPPPPAVAYRPRITFGRRLVLSRRRWHVPGVLLPQRRPDESAADFFLRVNRWRAETGIPEVTYLRVMPVQQPRPPRPGETPGEAEAAPEPEIPGYEAPVETPDEPEAAEGAELENEEAAKAEGEAAAGEGGERAGGPPVKRTQPSRDFHKPQFMDFANPLLVALLGRIGVGLAHFNVAFEERLPDGDALARHGGDAFATELVVQLNFPGGTASEAAVAAPLAEALPGE
jgi:hypothetical protein